MQRFKTFCAIAFVMLLIGQATADAQGNTSEVSPSTGSVLREAITAIENADSERYDNLDNLVVALDQAADLPAPIIEALEGRNVDLLAIGVELVEASDAELYEHARDVIEREQALLPERGRDAAGSGPPAPPAFGPEVMRQTDLEGLAVLETLDLRRLEVPATARIVLSTMPAPATGQAGPRPVEYEAARRELRDLQSTQVATPSRTGRILIITVLMIAVTAVMALVARNNQRNQLVDLAMTDSLTGLKNRRKLDHDLAVWKRAGRSTTALLMIDIDHFKHVNDRHGHATGDEVLRLVGAAIGESVRSEDVSYRYGGEEFCVLLPDTDDETAAAVGDRIRMAVAAIEVAGATVTASVGVASGPADSVTATAADADRALYGAKSAGRNQVVMAGDLAGC